jgi:hypothetical protein
VASTGTSVATKTDFSNLQKEVERLGYKVTKRGSTSDAALASVRDLGAKIQTLQGHFEYLDPGRAQKLPFDPVSGGQPQLVPFNPSGGDKPQVPPAR